MTSARVVMITGPIAAGKSALAAELAGQLRSAGSTVALVDLDTVAAMALPSLPDWAWAHRIHADLVGHWLASEVDVVVDEGTSTVAEVQQVRDRIPYGTKVLHVVLTADFETSLARAQGDPAPRGVSRDRDVLRRDHDRYARELPGLPGDLRLHVEGHTVQQLAALVRQAMSDRREFASPAVDGAVTCSWRGPVSDAELAELTESHGGRSAVGWWDNISQHSLGWVAARDRTGILVGFVNVAWDGGDHAFLLDTKTRGDRQRRGTGRSVVRVAVERARAAGCEWLHVDFDPSLADFYLTACGFRPTAAGLVRLR